jgi:hypothetical protein
MHQTGLFSAHGLSSAPAAQPFLRPSLALPLAAHVVYGTLAATGDAATCVGWDAPMRTWWATWGAAGRGSRPCSRSWSHGRCWRCVRTCVTARKGTQRSRGLADIGPRPRYRAGQLGPPDPATPGPRGVPFRNSFPLALLLAQRHRSARALRAGADAGGRTGGRRAARPSSWTYRGTGGYRCRHGTPSSCRCRSLSLLLAVERARRELLKPLGVTCAVSLGSCTQSLGSDSRRAASAGALPRPARRW